MSERYKEEVTEIDHRAGKLAPGPSQPLALATLNHGSQRSPRQASSLCTPGSQHNSCSGFAPDLLNQKRLCLTSSAEMTQALYAHMNNKTIKQTINKQIK
jgi:hypothetical protein